MKQFYAKRRDQIAGQQRQNLFTHSSGFHFPAESVSQSRFFMNAFKGGCSLTSCEKNVCVQLHYRAALLEEQAATACWCPVSAPFAALGSLREKPPVPACWASVCQSWELQQSGSCGEACKALCPACAGPAPAHSPEPACLMPHALHSR